MTDFQTIARTSAVAPGSMMRIEVGELEVLLANVDGEFYAVSDRCGHMCASLSAGVLRGREVACKMHGARFDVTTGKVVTSPPDSGLEQLRGYLGQLGMPDIRTCALDRYETKVAGDDIQIKLYAG
ncbi:MAG: Rieske (2Fe-2S) protein [Alphaproteobacteria bacterium]